MRVLRTILLLAVLAAIGAVTLWEAEERLSPGPLHPAHQRVPTLIDSEGCALCHGQGTGQDAMALRPTLLLAMAIKAASPEQRTILENVLKGDPDSPLQRLELLKLIFEQTDAFNQAEMLVEKSRERAEALADAVQPESLRHYLYFLIDTVLAPEEGAAEPENGPVLVSLSFPEES